MEHLASRLAAIPGVAAVTLGGSRATKRLRQTAPEAWFRLAAGALSFADVHAQRQDRVACLANLCQAVLATAHGRLAAAGEWALNEKRLVDRAGLRHIHDELGRPGRSLSELTSDIRPSLDLADTVWTDSGPDRA